MPGENAKAVIEERQRELEATGLVYEEGVDDQFYREDLNAADLTYIPLAIAGWLRYLLAVDDAGRPMACSSDPMLETLQGQLAGVELGRPESAAGKVSPILSNAVLFGVDLNRAGLGEKIEGMFRELLAGPGAVRSTLKKYL